MKIFRDIFNNQRGATIVYVGIILTVLVMFAALAIDVGHLYAVRNELQDAADAGALAGASVLLNSETGELQAAEAKQEAGRVVNLNKTGQETVAAKTIEIGHWSFHEPAPRMFYANYVEPPEQVDWMGKSMVELDGDIHFINAVKVVTERTNTPSFFARIFGHNNFLVRAEAVAYIGFAGSFQPGDFDQPIAICLQSITDAEGNLTCKTGRMINSGNDLSTSNTGGWTNFTQPCETATPPSVNPLVCTSGNRTEVHTGEGIGTTGGELQNVFNNILACWEAATNKARNWPLTLPVVDCPGNNVSNCATLETGVSLNVIWMINNISEGPNKYKDVPRSMTIYGSDGTNIVDSWSCTSAIDFDCWKSFVDKFGLRNAAGQPTSPTDIPGYEALYQQKAIFFMPNCEWANPTGGSGGGYATIPAEHPVLVQ